MTSMEPPTWRRVHPLALVFFFLAALRALAGQAMSLLPLVVLVALNETVRSIALPWGLVIGALVLLLVTALRYALFRFQVTSDRIHVRQGILQRRALTLEFDHIQQADVRVPWYYRPFGLANLSLDSVGARQQAAVISGLPLIEAEPLRNRILEYSDNTIDRHAKPADVDEPAPDYQLQLRLPDVLRYGLMHNGLLILLPLIFPAFNQLVRVMEQQLEQRMEVIWAEQAPSWLSESLTDGTSGLVLLIPILALVVLVMVTASVAAGLVRYYGYTLVQYGDRWQFSAGLLSHTTRSVRRPRIQLLTFRQSLIGRVLRRQSLIISKAGEAQGEADGDGRFVVPVLTPDSQRALAQQLGLPDDTEWRSVSVGFPVVRWALWCVIIAGASLVLLGPSWFVQWPWAAPAMAMVIAVGQWLGWRRFRVHRSTDWLALRRGIVGQQVKWLPIARIQGMHVQQSLWQRVGGHATLVVNSAGGQLQLPWLPRPLVDQWRDELLLQTARRNSESL